jgi:transcriptional regulator with XRE-family HTH domain
MNRLKATRFERNITQLQLYLVTGIWPSKISAIENDLLQPTEQEKERLAIALGRDKLRVFPASPEPTEGPPEIEPEGKEG